MTQSQGQRPENLEGEGSGRQHRGETRGGGWGGEKDEGGSTGQEAPITPWSTVSVTQYRQF